MKFLTVDTVAEALGVSTKTVRTYINKGELQAYKLGTAWKITEDDLNTFLQTKSNLKGDKSK